MFGKKRKVLKRVKEGLKKRTAGLESEAKALKYEETRVRMSVKNALNNMGIRDQAKRQRIHKTMQTMAHRFETLKNWGKVQTVSDTARIGFKDKLIDECRQELVEEFGDKKQAEKFYFKYMLSYAPLVFRLKSEKK